MLVTGLFVCRRHIARMIPHYNVTHNTTSNNGVNAATALLQFALYHLVVNIHGNLIHTWNISVKSTGVHLRKISRKGRVLIHATVSFKSLMQESDMDIKTNSYNVTVLRLE